MSNSWFVTYSGSLFHYAVEKDEVAHKERSYHLIKQTCTTYCSEENKFKSCAFMLHLRIIARENVIIYACESVISSESFLRKRYFILGSPDKQQFYLCTMQDTNLTNVAEIAYSAKDTAGDRCISDAIHRQLSCYIFDGPCIAIVDNNMVYYAALANKWHLRHVGYLLPEENTSSNNKTVSLLWCDRVGDYLFVLARKDATDEEDIFESDKETKKCTVNATIVASLLNCGSAESLDDSTDKILDSTNFIPAMYANIVVCIKIQKLADLDNVIASNRHAIVQKLIASMVFVCTSYSQLLAFSKGRLLRCAVLPFQDPKDIFLLKNGAGIEYVIVHSSSGNVCVVQKANLQISHTFVSIRQVFVGDFLCCGADQLLLVAGDDDYNGDIQYFCLTDFHSYNIDTLQQNTTETVALSEPTDNLQSAITALGARLQVGLASKDHVWKSSRLKSDLISQSCHNMHKLALHNELDNVKSKPHLHSLFSQTASPLPHCSMVAISDGVDQIVNVHRTWQRVIGDILVVGVHVINVSPSSLRRPQLSVFTTDSKRCQHTWRQQCWLAADRVTDNVTDRLTEQVTPGMAVCLSACCEMPHFTASDQQRFALLVTCQQSLEDEKQRSLSTTVCCGYIDISVKQMLSDELNVNWRHLQDDDIIALDTCQHQQYLLLTTSLSATSCLSQTLCSQLRFESQASHSDCDSCYVCRVIGALHMCRVCVKYVGEHELGFVVYCRNEFQLFLLLHTLYDNLPDDVVILPANELSRKLAPLTTRTLQALQAEIAFAARGLRDLLMESKRKVSSVVASTDVQSAQRELEQLREQHLAVDRTVCDPALFSRFKKALSKLQQLTDSTVVCLCKALHGNG